MRGRPWWAQDWYFAVALALFVGVSVWFGRAIQDFLAPSAKSISTPTLVGETVTDALSTAGRMHLKAVAVSRTPSDRFPKDVVMRQDPQPGAQVREGRQISIVVSSGVQIFPMPDLRYESLREVNLDLSHFKLVLGKVRTMSDDEVPANRVVSQDPAPLSSVRLGLVVNVVLSKGGPQNVRVPSFVGMQIDDARQYAQDSHVHLGQIVWTPFGRYGPPRGEIVRQRPDAKTVIDPAEQVSLQVSAGPREAGYIIRQVHAVAQVPEDAAASNADKAPSVRVQVHDETGTWNVYDAYAQPKQKLEFNLTVVGTAELDIFINNELTSSTKLGVEPAIQEKQQLGPEPAHVMAPNATSVRAPAPRTTADPDLLPKDVNP